MRAAEVRGRLCGQADQVRTYVLTATCCSFTCADVRGFIIVNALVLSRVRGRVAPHVVLPRQGWRPLGERQYPH